MLAAKGTGRVRPSPSHSPTHCLSHVHPPTCTLLICLSCRKELEAEVRLQVDDLMREELKNLKLVRPPSLHGGCLQS